MKKQTAKVVKIIDANFAEVEVRVAPLEVHDCCGGQQKPSFIHMRARNDADAALGDVVTIESDRDISLGFIVLVFAVMFILLIAGYMLWEPWGGFLPLIVIPVIWQIGKHRAKSDTVRIIAKSDNKTGEKS